jgi:DNA-binding NarL/FixJ family response regulator
VSQPPRTLLVDDHPMFREGLAAVLTAAGLADIVGEAGSGEEAVGEAARLRPDVVIMDLHLPGLNGIEATRQIVGANPDVAVLVLTMLENDESVFAALRAGARGYLVKGSTRAEIARALSAVTSGEVVLGAAVAGQVLSFFAADPGARAVLPFPHLTEREREILDLVAAGLTNRAIAGRLFLSEKTVRNYVSSVLAKVQADDRAAAIVKAREAGLGGRSGG